MSAIVDPAVATTDWGWFADNPGRRYRARRERGGLVVVVRRCPQASGPDVLLRVVATAAALVHDSDAALEARWRLAAYPWLPRVTRRRRRRAA